MKQQVDYQWEIRDQDTIYVIKIVLKEKNVYLYVNDRNMGKINDKKYSFQNYEYYFSVGSHQCIIFHSGRLPDKKDSLYQLIVDGYIYQKNNKEKQQYPYMPRKDFIGGILIIISAIEAIFSVISIYFFAPYRIFLQIIYCLFLFRLMIGIYRYPFSQYLQSGNKVISKNKSYMALFLLEIFAFFVILGNFLQK